MIGKSTTSAPPGSTVVHLESGLSDEQLRRDHPAFPLAIGPLWFSSDMPEQADWLVVASFVSTPVVSRVPRARRVLVMTEPGGYYPPSYVNQFGILISPFTVAGFRGTWIKGHGALPNWFGIDLPDGPLGYRDLMDMPAPQKQDIVSVVTTRKSVLHGHRLRLKFVRTLRDVLGSRLTLYGRGFHMIDDKTAAILPAKYHLVLENTVMPSYWTEKLADAYLGYALPIVVGPPDLERWFPRDSFVPVDLNRPEDAVATVVRTLDENIYADRFEAIVAARNRLMREERLCPVIARAIEGHSNDVPLMAAPDTIQPAPRAPAYRRVSREVARLAWQIDEAIRHRLHGD